MRKLVISCVFVLACSDSKTGTTETAIHKGDEAPELVKKVFALETANSMCSSAAIHYPRCLVSAAHCGDFSRALQGVDPFIDENPKQQPREILRKHGGANEDDFFHDLEIAWLKNYTPGKTARLQPPDYEPLEPIAMSGTTFGGLEIEKFVQFGPTNDPEKFSTAGIAGYGMSKDKGILAGAGVLRRGEVWVTAYYGYAFQTHAKKNLQQEICRGDSGGPLLFGGDLLGINSQSDPMSTCDGKSHHYHTAFDTLGVDKAQNNYDWTMDTIEEVCTKWQTVKIDGEGSVAGTITPAQARPVGGLRGNDQLQCPGDCQENFHAETRGRAAQSMSMTATPANGWTFSHWSSESKTHKCQCDGSGNASCDVAEGPMGYYDETTSIDEDVCIAHFVKDNDGGDSGYDSGYDSGNDSGNDAGSDAPDDADGGDSD